MIEETGKEYREITSPVDIEILTEEREIPASTTDFFYSDGDAPNSSINYTHKNEQTGVLSYLSIFRGTI